ncbi:hypothetical protein ACWGHU_12690 [Streptomyces xanthophaeus]
MQRALEAVEDQARGYRTGRYGRPQDPPAALEDERLRLEARLHDLLDDGSEA